MNPKSDDVTLVAGDNELSVEMVPIAVAPPFTFSNVSASMVTMQDAPAFNTIIYRCRVTNPGSSPATKRLNVMYKSRRYKTYDSGWTDWWQTVYWSFDLTLNPGQSYDFVWNGNTYGQRDPDAYNGPLVAMRTDVCMWLEDEEENKSEEGCVSRWN